MYLPSCINTLLVCYNSLKGLIVRTNLLCYWKATSQFFFEVTWMFPISPFYLGCHGNPGHISSCGTKSPERERINFTGRAFIAWHSYKGFLSAWSPLTVCTRLKSHLPSLSLRNSQASGLILIAVGESEGERDKGTCSPGHWIVGLLCFRQN